MKKSFGSIFDSSIKEIISKNEIQQLWNITKDEVEICRDCEYRYCCTDCRVYIDNPDNIYSRPSKCNYNPYIGIWKGEEGYVEVNKWIKMKKK